MITQLEPEGIDNAPGRIDSWVTYVEFGIKIISHCYLILHEFSPNDSQHYIFIIHIFNISGDYLMRTEWLLFQYGSFRALFHAIRLDPTFINLSVARAIISKGAILSRYFVQRLLVQFGRYDQQLIKLKTINNARNG
ncbi:21791_t:CDS:2 [Cetraspora pellucida]|uniref:21791_t:CDS:1 n=1 Tax=Cetraspora pellucida TaxID=1433469 RepID=A0A9N9CMW4_9GLOM|nr:21791_t:CDS:2 [Cetraspora pellucida]